MKMGLWKGKTLTPAPIRIFFVRAAMLLSSGIREGQMPYRLEWCSAAQIESNPSSSAYSACSSISPKIRLWALASGSVQEPSKNRANFMIDNGLLQDGLQGILQVLGKFCLLNILQNSLFHQASLLNGK